MRYSSFSLAHKRYCVPDGYEASVCVALSLPSSRLGLPSLSWEEEGKGKEEDRSEGTDDGEVEEEEEEERD